MALAFCTLALVSFGLSAATQAPGAGASDRSADAGQSEAHRPGKVDPEHGGQGQADEASHDQGRPSGNDQAGPSGNGQATRTGNDQGQAVGGANGGPSSERTRSGGDDAGNGHGGRETGPALNQPQPASIADFSGHGANQHGAYDSTRDGSPSGNGNGGGEAAGKPCAGCVGKADNKNPLGQRPDGSDHNKGYECDTNHGIGRTNPAHTGCRSTSTAPCVPTAANPCTTSNPPCVPTAANPCTTSNPPCVPSEANPCTTSNPPCVPTEANPCTASTQSVCVATDTNPCAEVVGDKPLARLAVLGVTIERPFGSLGSPDTGNSVLGAVVQRGATGQLPRTGSGTLEMAGVAVGLVLAGALLALASRRRSVTA